MNKEKIFENPQTGEQIELELENGVIGEMVGYDNGNYTISFYATTKNNKEMVFLTRSYLR